MPKAAAQNSSVTAQPSSLEDRTSLNPRDYVWGIPNVYGQQETFSHFTQMSFVPMIHFSPTGMLPFKPLPPGMNYCMNHWRPGWPGPTWFGVATSEAEVPLPAMLSAATSKAEVQSCTVPPTPQPPLTSLPLGLGSHPMSTTRPVKAPATASSNVPGSNWTTLLSKQSDPPTISTATRFPVPPVSCTDFPGHTRPANCTANSAPVPLTTSCTSTSLPEPLYCPPELDPLHDLEPLGLDDIQKLFCEEADHDKDKHLSRLSSSESVTTAYSIPQMHVQTLSQAVLEAGDLDCMEGDGLGDLLDIDALFSHDCTELVGCMEHDADCGGDAMHVGATAACMPSAGMGAEVLVPRAARPWDGIQNQQAAALKLQKNPGGICKSSSGRTCAKPCLPGCLVPSDEENALLLYDLVQLLE